MRNRIETTTQGIFGEPSARTRAGLTAVETEEAFCAARSGSGAAREKAAERHLAQLRQKLRRERALGRGGHTGYDLSRHLALAQMVKAAEKSAISGAAARARREKSGGQP